MTESEALALAAEHLRTWECQTCGAVWLTGKSKSGALFHRCRPPRRSRRYTFPEIVTDRETARTELMEALLDAQGPESIWRPLDEEEE